MDEFKRQKAEFEQAQQHKKRIVDQYLRSMRESARALEVAPAYSLQPDDQQQNFATAVRNTSPQAPRPTRSSRLGRRSLWANHFRTTTRAASRLNRGRDRLRFDRRVDKTMSRVFWVCCSVRDSDRRL